MTTHDRGTSPDHPLVPGAQALDALGVSAPNGPPTSSVRFPDGGAWRIEIPSVEGPAPLAALIEEAERLEVPVHRVSQGSGVMMLTDDEITEMISRCAEADIELNLFLGPRGTWDVGGAVRSPSGGSGPRARGHAQLAHAVADARRATSLGVRSLLVADEGVLWGCNQLRERGELPDDVRFKVSVLSAPVNPLAFALYGQLGADSINVPSDLTLEQVAELRSASPIAMDFYLEAPDDVGGFVRLPEAAELVRVGAPIYLKMGIRNAPVLYPVGRHLQATATELARERVRRARLVLDQLEALGDAVPAPSGRPAHHLPRPTRLSPVAQGDSSVVADTHGRHGKETASR